MPSPTEMFVCNDNVDMSVAFDNHYGHGTPCPYDYKHNVCVKP